MSQPDALSPAAPKPDHVSPTSVYDFDSYRDAAFLRDPRARAAEILKEAPPVFWTPRNGGHWMIQSYDAVFNAARDFESFSSEFITQAQIAEMSKKMPPGSPPIMQALPASVDPPTHTKYRAPINSAFAPKAVQAMTDGIRALAVELIEAVRPKGRCELMAEIAEPLPVDVFLQMYGLPVERRDEYRAIVKKVLSTPFLGAPKPGPNPILEAVRGPLLARRDNPQTDIISTMWQFKIDDEPMTLPVMESYSISLFLAGLDTVMNAIGHAVRHLALNPQLQEQLRANPQLIPDAVEEMLRLYAFAVPLRLLAKDTVFEGVEMRKGERALFFLPAANQDPNKYPDPNTFNLNRENRVHITFGAGPHRCLGSHLARIELQIFYQELLARLPTFRLDPDKPVVFHGGTVIGPDALHLLWDV